VGFTRIDIVSKSSVFLGWTYIYRDCEHIAMPRSAAYIAEPSIQSRVAMKKSGTGVDFVESWFNVITEYSTCELIYGTDKPFAISVAKVGKLALEGGMGEDSVEHRDFLIILELVGCK
jgi:hypothetical protein